MQIRTKVIREGRALYLLEDVALPEGQPLIVTIEIPAAGDVDENGNPLDQDSVSIQETLTDTPDLDLEDKRKPPTETQRQILQELVGMFKVADYPPDGTPSAAVHHDKYIYRIDW